MQSHIDPDKGKGVRVKYAKSKNQSDNQPARSASECGCAARSHPLFTNCTLCGRIFCIKEAYQSANQPKDQSAKQLEARCYVCDSIVTLHTTKHSPQFVEFTRLVKQLTNQSTDQSSSQSEAANLERAEAAKRRLLEYAKANNQSIVEDGQLNYFEAESNVWLTDEQRKQATNRALDEENKLFSAGKHTISIDFLTGQVVANQRDAFGMIDQPQSDGAMFVTKDDLVKQSNNQSIWGDDSTSQSLSSQPISVSYVQPINQLDNRSVLLDDLDAGLSINREHYFRNESLNGRARAVYERLQATLEQERIQQSKNQSSTNDNFQSPFASRVQYDEPAEVKPQKQSNKQSNKLINQTVKYSLSCEQSTNQSDAGIVLSMHQPWASLLVLGIKRLEGRPWSTSHRGRLWIAAAAAVKTPEDIEEIEQAATAVYQTGGQVKVPFPATYPRSCLLGCVDLVDCLDQTELQKCRAATGLVENSQNGFVFVCANPQMLALPQTITGQHKLWQLPANLLKAVQAGLQPVDTAWRDKADRLAAGSKMTGAQPGGLKKKQISTKFTPRQPNEA